VGSAKGANTVKIVWRIVRIAKSYYALLAKGLASNVNNNFVEKFVAQ
jgi:hypothetical protein